MFVYAVTIGCRHRNGSSWDIIGMYAHLDDAVGFVAANKHGTGFTVEEMLARWNGAGVLRLGKSRIRTFVIE